MPTDPAPGLSAQLRQPAPELGPRALRTIESILDATREIFLTRGYGGTSIDDITTRAGVSRASFYTYFPSKRDAMLALGDGATRAARDAIARLDDLPDTWTTDDLADWLRTSLEFLDTYGSFGLAWGQAAHEDDELREVGMRTHLRTCRQFGARLNKLRGEPLAQDEALGLIVFSMLERTWSQLKLYEPTVTDDDIVEAGAQVIGAIAGR